jgi:hypothetical protein
MPLRLKVSRRLLPRAEALALSRNGAFVLEAAFQIGDLKTRASICQSLKSNAVHRGAVYIWKNFRMDCFVSRSEQWDRDTKDIIRRASAMQEIITEMDIPDAEPLAPVLAEPTPEMEAAAQELEGVIGVLRHRQRRRKVRQADEEAPPEEE